MLGRIYQRQVAVKLKWMDIEKQVQKAASLIAQLCEVDTDFRVFGSQSHRYRIGPPLSEGELRAFETKHGVELPADYRLYLKTVGNGNDDRRPRSPHESVSAKAGAGPQYGIYRLEDDLVGERIREPFPFVQKTQIDDELVDLWNGDIPGVLNISTEGCGNDTYLIVRGEAYGTVLYSWDLDSFWPTGLSFTEWICQWAEHRIPLVIREKVANPVREGMSVEEVVAICGDGGRQPYSLERWRPEAALTLRFEGLATVFEVDDRHVVTRVTKYSL